jgi:hypothetical protein
VQDEDDEEGAWEGEEDDEEDEDDEDEEEEMDGEEGVDFDALQEAGMVCPSPSRVPRVDLRGQQAHAVMIL